MSSVYTVTASDDKTSSNDGTGGVQSNMANNGDFQRLPTKELLDDDDEQKNGVSAGEIDGYGLSDGSSSLTDTETIERGTWSKSIEFLLSCVGFAVGLGNVWRFPYLCYQNGGGVFLIPYFIFLIVGGMPLFFLEISVGQFMGIAGIKVWNFAPILKGVGYATTVILFLMNSYYIIILAWDGFYLADTLASIGSPLPWSLCGQAWNTDSCKTDWFTKSCKLVSADNITDSLLNTTTAILGNSTSGNMTEVCETISNKGSDSVTEYWNHRILRRSNGIDEVGSVVWQLALSLLVAWVVCYFCIWKGVKWTGKVVYFTATFPYVVITILLIRGATLEGAVDGIIFYLKPDFSKLNDIDVWIDAGTQIFFSYAVAIGSLTALGSYNKIHNNCHRQVIFIALINTGTSLYAGLAIFSVLGFMAHEQNVSIANVTDKGPGLAFIAYPKAITAMPFLPHFWAVLFFIMIVFVGLDSQFVAVESFVTTIIDIFPAQLRKPYRREVIAAIYCFVSFLIGLTMVTEGGVYVFELFNYYSASGLSLLWVGFFECAAVAWVYGAGRFYDNLELMLGFRILRWFRICWMVLTPLSTGLLYLAMWVKFEPLTYSDYYTYPIGAQAIGLCMAFASMLCIPGYAIFAMIKAEGTLKERWRYLTTPVFTDRQLAVTPRKDGGFLSKRVDYDSIDEMKEINHMDSNNKNSVLP